MAFNSSEYDWSDVTVVMAGRNVTGIRGIKYNTKQEKELLYAKGNRAHGIQKGNKSCEGSIKILQSEYEALVEAAKDGDILDLSFNILVSYGNSSGPIKTDLVKGVEFTESPKEINQNDKFMEIELPFIALDIKKNYV